MAAPAKQQPELNLQGSLFATGTFAAETPPDPHPETTPATAGSEPLPELFAESDSDRPRQRRASKAPAADNAPSPESGTEAAAEPDDDSDMPAWHHHGLVDPEQLTPMLRHYVEL